MGSGYVSQRLLGLPVLGGVSTHARRGFRVWPRLLGRLLNLGGSLGAVGGYLFSVMKVRRSRGTKGGRRESPNTGATGGSEWGIKTVGI